MVMVMVMVMVMALDYGTNAIMTTTMLDSRNFIICREEKTYNMRIYIEY